MSCRQVAIIPARGGSKRLPRKNMLPVAGRPMLAYPIESALLSGLFCDVVVSTEDALIAREAKKFGATVVHRPDKLAQDRSTVVQVCDHVLSQPKYHDVDCFCCLYATAVLITPEDLERSRELLDAPPMGDFVMGVSSFNYPPVLALKQEGSFLSPMWPEYRAVQSQFYPDFSVSNGTIYWARKEAFLQNMLFYGERLKGYHLSESKGIDVDTPDDYAELLRIFKTR